MNCENVNPVRNFSDFRMRFIILSDVSNGAKELDNEMQKSHSLGWGLMGFTENVDRLFKEK